MEEEQPILDLEMVPILLSQLLVHIKESRGMILSQVYKEVSDRIYEDLLPTLGKQFARIWTPDTLRWYKSAKRIKGPVPLQNLNAFILVYMDLVKKPDLASILYLYRTNGQVMDFADPEILRSYLKKSQTKPQPIINEVDIQTLQFKMAKETEEFLSSRGYDLFIIRRVFDKKWVDDLGKIPLKESSHKEFYRALHKYQFVTDLQQGGLLLDQLLVSKNFSPVVGIIGDIVLKDFVFALIYSITLRDPNLVIVPIWHDYYDKNSSPPYTLKKTINLYLSHYFPEYSLEEKFNMYEVLINKLIDGSSLALIMDNPDGYDPVDYRSIEKAKKCIYVRLMKMPIQSSSTSTN